MTKASILVVDDEPNNFDVIETLLTDQAYQLNYASSGTEALDSLDTFCPDVILLDVMMPGLDGLEVCRQIKSNPCWQMIPVIMVTALSSKSDLAHCLETGADDFVSKPINSVELRARVHSMLRIKQQYDRLQSFTEIQRDTINMLGNSLQELRGNLALSLPHEFNTPLNGILGGIELLRADLESMDSDEIHELLSISLHSARRLERLTRKFLTYLQLELSDKQPTIHTGIATQDVIVPLAQTQAEQANRAADLICKVGTADVALSLQDLKRIIEEVLDNAFKFSPPGSPVKVEGELVEGQFHLWICDRGRGMTAEQISSIGAFSQFERATYEQQGVGLGLKIAIKLVESYGGKLLLSSVYQQQTTVHIILPVVSHPI